MSEDSFESIIKWNRSNLFRVDSNAQDFHGSPARNLNRYCDAVNDVCGGDLGAKADAREGDGDAYSLPITNC